MRPRQQFIAVLAAATAALVAAPPAIAVDVPVSFDYAVLDTEATPDRTVVDPSRPPITAIASVEDDGSFTVDPATFEFPRYEFSSPARGSIDVILNEPAAGHVDFATGQVTLTADLQAQIDVPALGGACHLNTGDLVLSTENSEPFPGRRFPAGSTGVVTGPGAITVSWTSLPPGTGPSPVACSVINPYVGGPGGFWLSKGIAPPTGGGGEYDAAALKVRVKPAKRTVRGGKAATFRARVTNTGDESTEGVSVCVKVPKGLKPAKRLCRAYGALAAGQSKTRAFKLKTRRSGRTRRYRLVFRAAGEDATPGKGVARLIVEKR